MSKSEDVKNQARDGLFHEIREQAGEKSESKALEWLRKKLIDASEGVRHVGPLETPFMTACLSRPSPKSLTNDDLRRLGAQFNNYTIPVGSDIIFDDADSMQDNGGDEVVPEPAKEREASPPAVPEPEPEPEPEPVVKVDPAEAMPQSDSPVTPPTAPAKKSSFKPPAQVAAPIVLASSSVTGGSKANPKSKAPKKDVGRSTKLPLTSSLDPASASGSNAAVAVAGKGTKRKADPAEPKRGPSAFQVFAKEQRATYITKNPDDKPKDIQRGLGDLWKNASKTDKAKYESAAADEKVVQNSLRDAYFAAHPEMAEAAAAAAAAKPAKPAKKKAKGTDEKPAGSGKAKKQQSKSSSAKVSRKPKASSAAGGDQGDSSIMGVDDSVDGEGEGEGEGEGVSVRQLPSRKAKDSLCRSGGFAEADSGSERDDDDEGMDVDRQLSRGKSAGAGAEDGDYEDEDEDEDEDEEAGEGGVSSAARDTTKAHVKPSSSSSSSSKSGVAPKSKLKPKPKPKPKATGSARELDEAPLLETPMVPTKRVVLPSDDPSALEPGAAVIIVLTPYRAFLSSLPQALLSPQERALVQQLCTQPDDAQWAGGVVNAVRTVGPSGAPVAFGRSYHPESEALKAELKIVTVTVTKSRGVGGVGGAGGGSAGSAGGPGGGQRVVNVLWTDFTSSLLTGDRFFLTKTDFEASLRVPWLEIGSPVRRLFAAEQDDAALGSDSQATPDPNASAEFLEGIVYDCKQAPDDLRNDPYNAVSVVWLSQESSTKSWVYSASQPRSACSCSPWDLERSEFQLTSHKFKPPSFPKCFSVGPLSAASIIDYLKHSNASDLFTEPVSENLSYRSIFPQKQDQLDLCIISKQAARGRYDCGGSDYVGITTLFRDLEKMTQQSKTVNSSNADFLSWRMADIMEKAVTRVKRYLATNKDRPIASLLEAVEQDRSLQQELDMEVAQEI